MPEPDPTPDDAELLALCDALDSLNVAAIPGPAQAQSRLVAAVRRLLAESARLRQELADSEAANDDAAAVYHENARLRAESAQAREAVAAEQEACENEAHRIASLSYAGWDYRTAKKIAAEIHARGASGSG